jgi:hypothetical protein
VICAVTEDGDLRVWWDVLDDVREARLDVGGTDDCGPIKTLELDVRDDDGLSISVLVMHYRATTFGRYTLKVDASGEYTVDQRVFVTPLKSPLTAIKTLLEPALPISAQSRQIQPSLLMLLEDDDDSDDSSSRASPLLRPQSDDDVPVLKSSFGRLVVAGDAHGSAWIWAWDGEATEVSPIRGWAAVERRVTAVDYHCGLVAVAG